MESGEPIALELIYDSSEFGPSARRYRKAEAMLGRYSATLGQLRLSLRGLSYVVVAPIAVQQVDVASPTARAVTLISMLPYMLVLVTFMGGFYLAIDTTAGERENKSLEPLLTQPVSRRDLVLGKMAATFVFALLMLFVFLTVFTAAVPFLPLHKIGLRLEFGPLHFFKIFLVSLPLVYLGAALLTLVASYAKSYKEAQTYLSGVILVPTLPIVVTQLLNLDLKWWLMLIPSQSQATLITLLIEGEPVRPLYVGLSAVSTIAVGTLFAAVAVSLYKKERILG